MDIQNVNILKGYFFKREITLAYTELTLALAMVRSFPEQRETIQRLIMNLIKN